MLLPEFIPDHYKTPQAQAAIKWLLTHVDARRDTPSNLVGDTDKRLLREIAHTLLDEMLAKKEATPSEEVAQIVDGYLGDWHRDFGADIDEMEAQMDAQMTAALKRGTFNSPDTYLYSLPPNRLPPLLGENLISFPLPGLFRITGFPLLFGGDEREAYGFLKGFRAMARDAWEARAGQR